MLISLLRFTYVWGDYYADMLEDAQYYDTSNHDLSHAKYNIANKQKLGCFKDETAGIPIDNFYLIIWNWVCKLLKMLHLLLLNTHVYTNIKWLFGTMELFAVFCSGHRPKCGEIHLTRDNVYCQMEKWWLCLLEQFADIGLCCACQTKMRLNEFCQRDNFCSPCDGCEF